MGSAHRRHEPQPARRHTSPGQSGPIAVIGTSPASGVASVRCHTTVLASERLGVEPFRSRSDIYVAHSTLSTSPHARCASRRLQPTGSPYGSLFVSRVFLHLANHVRHGCLDAKVREQLSGAGRGLGFRRPHFSTTRPSCVPPPRMPFDITAAVAVATVVAIASPSVL